MTITREGKEKMSKSKLGAKNPRWNGGNSEYKDHALLKKNRLLALKEAKGLCEICGKDAKLVHHVDGSKENHELSNLSALCSKCHWAVHREDIVETKQCPMCKMLKQIGTSKYKREYGITQKELSEKLNASVVKVAKWHKNPEKREWIHSILKTERDRLYGVQDANIN